MTPKPKTTPAKASAREKKEMEQEAAQKKRNQANMIGQIKQAVEKLKRRKAGEVSLSPEQVAQPETKAAFHDQYYALGRKSQEKDQMLSSFL